MNRLCLALVVTIAVTAVPGCGGMLLPRWGQPGSAAYQQTMAELFDPYPEDEVGQEILGVRPREYQHPIPEPLRGRRLPWGQGGS